MIKLQKNNETILAWYFSDESRTLRHGDGREIALGVTHSIEGGDPKLYERGLHGSVRILDALKFAPGPVVYRVELSGKMDVGADKIAATRRRYIAGGIAHVVRENADGSVEWLEAE